MESFFIYDELLAYYDMRCGISSGTDVHSFIRGVRSHAPGQFQWDYGQHMAEMLFPRQLATHPLRTRLPHMADMFVVPAYLGLSERGYCGSHEDNAQFLRGFLRNSTWFHRRRGRDHVLVATDHVMKLHEEPSSPLRYICLGTQVSTLRWIRTRRDSAGDGPTIHRANMVAVPLVSLPPPNHQLSWRSRPITLFFAGATHGQAGFYEPRKQLLRYHYRVPSIMYSTSAWWWNRQHRRGKRIRSRLANASLHMRTRGRRFSSASEVGGVAGRKLQGGAREETYMSNEKRGGASRVTSTSRRPSRRGRVHVPPPCHLPTLPNCSRRFMKPCGNDDEHMSGGCVALSPESTTPEATAARLAKARFSLSWPGDHGMFAVSSRIYDAVAMGAINVFLGERILQETIGLKALPWRNMSVVVDPVAFEIHQAQAIEQAVQRAEKDTAWLEQALLLNERHAPDIVWTHPLSRVAENVMKACYQRMEGTDGCDPLNHVATSC